MFGVGVQILGAHGAVVRTVAAGPRCRARRRRGRRRESPREGRDSPHGGRGSPRAVVRRLLALPLQSERLELRLALHVRQTTSAIAQPSATRL